MPRPTTWPRPKACSIPRAWPVALYGARTTPHMFVIDPKGNLIYAGGIDNTPSPDPATIASAKNYVTAALDEAMAGKPVTTPPPRPMGVR